ncbi:MAG: aspartate aminotransferase family protein [Elusimicrobia bacterium]|nr:aspartate aminotransferase family protein [Elusimicrobiota bacterium]
MKAILGQAPKPSKNHRPHHVKLGVSRIPGSKSRRLFQEEQRYIAPGLQTIALLPQLAIERGDGSLLTDVDGNTFIDFHSGVSVCSLGYGHPRYVAALKVQLEKIAVGSFTTRNRLELVKLIARLVPRPLRRTQLFSSGAEAVEAAIRLAKSFTKKFHLFGFWSGFHGKTAGVLGLGGPDWKNEVGPLPPGIHLAAYADCYRCPFQTTFPQCGFLCVEHLREQIKTEANGQVAAIVVEPIQGTAGNVVPPPGYLKVLQEVAREQGALLLADEIITGFGRTGRMFACEHDKVVPDIMTVGKGMGSGFPVSGVISSDEITKAEPWSRPSAASSSYGGNPLASTAALATLRAILDDHLVLHAERVGALMLRRLQAMQEKYEFIGDVRGKGLLIGIDLVKDRKTKEPLPRVLTEQIFLEALKRGLLMMGYTARIRIHPALTLPERLAEEGLNILDETFQAILPRWKSLT